MPGEDNSNLLNLDSYDTSVLFKREIVNTLDSSITSTSDEDLDKFLFFKTVSTTTDSSNPFLFKTVQTKLKVSSHDDNNNSNNNSNATPQFFRENATTATTKSAKNRMKIRTNSTSSIPIREFFPKLVSNDSEYGDF